MKISVLISTYNGEKFLAEQLESLLCQTCKIDEVVIVDDCSTDNTVAIARQYISDHCLEDAWKVYVNEQNVGWRINFMRGVTMTTGDILFFCDQDDIWLENKVEIMVGVLEKNQQLTVAASNETLWDGNVSTKAKVTSDVFDIIEMGKQEDTYFIRCSGCTMAIRRTFIDRVLKYHKDGWAHDDFFWKIAGLDGTLALVRESTILHRIHGNNESRKKRTLSKTLSGLKTDIMVAEQLLEYLLENQTNIHNAKDKIEIVKHKKHGSMLRQEFFSTKKLSTLIKLALRFPDIYGRKRQIIKDFLLAWNIG